MYVVEYSNNRVQRLNANLSYHSMWGTAGSGDGQFNAPWGIVMTGEKKLYVGDTSGNNNHRIQIFQLTGFFLGKFGGYGSSTGKFNSPRGLATDESNNIYVVEYGGHRLQKFDKSGGFITTWGGKGSGDSQLYYPVGVAYGAGGFVFIADTYNHRIVKYTASGTFVTKWGSEGNGDGQFKHPKGIAVGKDSMVYVADSGNHRLQKFDANGNLKYVWGQYGTGDGQMNQPTGICVGSDLKVWITEHNGQRIQRFRLNKAPTAPTKVTVKPTLAFDNTDLVANATGSTDADGDPLSYRYQWWKSSDGTTFTKGPALKVLNRAQTTVGQTWKVQAWAYDGVARSPKVYSAEVLIRKPNTKPTAPTSVVITPNHPVDDSKLTATASGATDADGDTLTYRYQWWLSTDGGSTWKAGPTKKVVPASSTKVGQKWKVQAWAHDGIAKSSKVYSAAATILRDNKPPTAPSLVKVTPASPKDGDKLTATASGATDPDGDALTYRYQWYRSTDGTTWVQGPVGRFVDPSLTQVGEYWRCRAKAFDGMVTGPARLSATVKIGAGSASALALTATAQGGEISPVVVSLSAPANVRATITNVAGIVVAELPARHLEAGISTLSWNGMGTSGSKVPGGVYLVRVTAATADGNQTSVLVPLRR